METGFEFKEPQTPEPVRIEQVFAEKPGGGRVANPDKDYPATTAVYFDEDDELYHCIDKDGAAPEGKTPEYVTGNKVYAGKGDQRVRLINGANLRKETANISGATAALLPTIKLV